jgi:hypothetical protein
MFSSAVTKIQISPAAPTMTGISPGRFKTPGQSSVHP